MVMQQLPVPGRRGHKEPGPLSGLAAYGVPVGYTPSGTPMVRAGQANQALQLPPDLPGMPRMPGPHPGLFGGGIENGGLFRPATPVVPFDFSNQVQRLQEQERRAKQQSIPQQQPWIAPPFHK